MTFSTPVIDTVLMRAPNTKNFSALAIDEHTQLIDAVQKCGVTVTLLGGVNDFELGVFTGSMMVASEYLAIVMNPGAQSERQGEQQITTQYLAPSRFVKFVKAPAISDAGDVVRVGGLYFIGVSKLTNSEGAAQIAYYLKESGHLVTIVEPKLSDIATLSNGVCDLGQDRILIRDEMAKNYAFFGYDMIKVPASEKTALSSLYLNSTLIMPQGCPKTAQAVKDLGIPVIETPFFELGRQGFSIKQTCVSVPKTPANALYAHG